MHLGIVGASPRYVAEDVTEDKIMKIRDARGSLFLLRGGAEQRKNIPGQAGQGENAQGGAG